MPDGSRLPQTDRNGHQQVPAEQARIANEGERRSNAQALSQYRIYRDRDAHYCCRLQYHVEVQLVECSQQEKEQQEVEPGPHSTHTLEVAKQAVSRCWRDDCRHCRRNDERGERDEYVLPTQIDARSACHEPNRHESCRELDGAAG